MEYIAPTSRRRPSLSKTYHDAAELVVDISLVDVFCHEERGRRLDWTAEELEGLNFPISSNSLGIQRLEDSFNFRFRVVYTDANAEYVADWVAQFAVPDEPEAVDESVLTEFAEKVAFFTVYPYVRASIFGSASGSINPYPSSALLGKGNSNEAMS